MVLETLMSPLKAEAHPAQMILFGAIYATLGLWLGYWIFQDHASLIMVFLTTMAAAPLVYNIIKVEEKKDLTDINEWFLLGEHARAILVFLSYFLGATLAFAFWYVVLPNNMISPLFQVQIDTYLTIRGSVTGQAFNSFGVFSDILSNNLKVLIFCILFSFLYGLGAIFILTWNASVIGLAIGYSIREGLANIHFWSIQHAHISAGVISYGLLQFALHGFFEILAYFVAGLAGSIISVAAIRHDFGTKKYTNIIMDSSVLILLSLFILVFAAFLEVYITPLIF